MNRITMDEFKQMLFRDKREKPAEKTATIKQVSSKTKEPKPLRESVSSVERVRIKKQEKNQRKKKKR